MAKDKADIARCVRCREWPTLGRLEDGWHILHQCQQFVPRGVTGYETPDAAIKAWAEMNADYREPNVILYAAEEYKAGRISKDQLVETVRGWARSE